MANKIFSLNDPAKSVRTKRWTYADLSMTADNRWRLNKNRDPYNDHIRGKYRVSRKFDVNAVKGAVHNLFHWTKGERIIQPEFGNELKKLLYNQIGTYTEEQIIAEIKMMIARWEPRCIIDKLSRIGDVSDTEHNQIGIQMIWHVDGLPDQQYQTEVIY